MIEGGKVTKYFGGLAAVTNVDFHVNQGEILGLIGPNGAGKTTLFNLISGALFPTSGLIRFKGENITHLKPHQICKRGIARTFQAGNLFTTMTVFENVLLGALCGRSVGICTFDAQQEATELLEFVGLSDKRDFLAKDLTFAAQRRLEIARALATKPELLMLDEAMAGLNSAELAQSLELIRTMRDKGITIFLTEHVMKAIMGISERILVLHHGEKIAEGTPQEIAKSKAVIEVYLGK
jgi:branched-chain amino acid transport system ATP-binding protein